MACVTCGKLYPATGQGCAQAGHFIPGRKAAYLFDERQVNAQCYNCNHTLKGNWPPYYELMIKRHGQAVVDDMIYRQRNEIVKFTIPELEEMEQEYRAQTDKLPEGAEYGSWVVAADYLKNTEL